jgi:phage tail sheath protein FI
MINTDSKAPGVYVDPITAAGPIAGAGTSTAALVGKVVNAATGVTMGVPRAITNWTTYTNLFGEFQSALPLPYAVRGFFENGGTLAYIVPVSDTADLTGPLGQLTRVAEVNLVCVPGVVDTAAQNAVIKHCQDMRNRFAILDGATEDDGQDDPLDQKGALRTQLNNLTKSEFAGVYWPWIVVDDPAAATGASRLVTVPASGHVAGIMARSDGQYGVHKAPANEPVNGARDLGYPLNDTEHGQLNKANVNAIRRFPGRPPLVWGARTLAENTAWRYVNVRRLVSYIEESIVAGLRWAVFAPNNIALWKGLERTITEFLTRVWLSGALFGRTAAEAFYVKIDQELNPPDVRALGQVVVEVGLAPVQPAEFVIVRLGLWDGGSQVSEG